MTSNDWLPIGPASRLLGVDPDTLRRWSDDGRIDSFATPGGHRRFSRRALEQVLATGRRRGRPLASLGATTDRLSAAYRRRYAAVRNPESSVAGSVPARQRAVFRNDGRRLVDALLRHLDAEAANVRETAEQEATMIVDALGRRLARAGIDLSAAIALFVAARRPFLSELASLGRRRSLEPARLAAVYDDASALLDRLLLQLVASHQRARG
jgi:excisionase family DNA binding protein